MVQYLLRRSSCMRCFIRKNTRFLKGGIPPKYRNLYHHFLYHKKEIPLNMFSADACGKIGAEWFFAVHMELLYIQLVPLRHRVWNPMIRLLFLIFIEILQRFFLR